MSKDGSVKVVKESGAWGFVLFVAFFGALVYFVQHSEGFWGFILAILKALVWPALVMYELLEALNL